MFIQRVNRLVIVGGRVVLHSCTGAGNVASAGIIRDHLPRVSIRRCLMRLLTVLVFELALQ